MMNNDSEMRPKTDKIIQYKNLTMDDLYSFDDILYKTILTGNVKKLKELLASIIFKTFYKKDWTFKKKRPRFDNASPLRLALERHQSYNNDNSTDDDDNTTNDEEEEEEEETEEEEEEEDDNNDNEQIDDDEEEEEEEDNNNNDDEHKIDDDDNDDDHDEEEEEREEEDDSNNNDEHKIDNDNDNDAAAADNFAYKAGENQDDIEDNKGKKVTYEIIKLLLNSNSTMYDHHMSFLECVIHSGKQNLDIFYLVIDSKYKNKILPKDFNKILFKLLIFEWVDEFKYFMTEFDIDAYTFFHTPLSKYPLTYPVSYLCADAQANTVLYLLDTYSKDTLNIGYYNDTTITDLSDSSYYDHDQYIRALKNADSDDDDDDELGITCPQQEFVSDLKKFIKFPNPEYHTVIEKSRILKKLLALNYFDEKAIFNTDMACMNRKNLSKDEMFLIQYKNPLLLECGYLYGDKNDIDEIERLYSNIIGVDETNILSLKSAVNFLGHFGNRLCHRDYTSPILGKEKRFEISYWLQVMDVLNKKILDYIKQFGYMWKSELLNSHKTPLNKHLLTTVKEPLLKNILTLEYLLETILILYQEIGINVNEEFTSLDDDDSLGKLPLDCSILYFKFIFFLLEQLLGNWNTRNKCEYNRILSEFYDTDDISLVRIITEIINVMFVAGEKCSVSDNIPLFYLKSRDDKQYHEILKHKTDEEFKNIKIPCQICPFRGPGRDLWIENMIKITLEEEGDQYQPNLFEMSRKAIRECIQEYNPNLNLYTAIETLSLPEILTNALLFNKTKKDFKKLIKEMNMH